MRTNRHCVLIPHPTLLDAKRYVGFSINSTTEQKCEVEYVVSNSLMSWTEATTGLKLDLGRKVFYNTFLKDNTKTE